MQKLYQLYNKYFFWVIVALMAFIPLYPKLPLLNVSGTFVAIRLEDFLIAATLIIWAIFSVPKIKTYLHQPILQAMILFWLIGGLGVLSGVFITNSVNFHLGFFNWLRRIEFMSLFLVGATVFRTLKQIRILVGTIVLTTILVSLYGFGQVWLHFPVISTSNNEYSKGLILTLTPGTRVNSTFAGQYDLAIYLNIALAILSSLFFYYKKLFQKIVVLVASGLGFVLLTMTTARMSFAATMTSVALAFWLTGKKLLIGLLILGGIAALIISPDLRHRIVATVTVNLLNGGGPKYNPPAGTVNIFTPIQKIPPAERNQYLAQALKESTLSASQSSKIPRDISAGEPINSTELGVYRSLGIRTNVEWPRAIRAFKENPLLGTGYSSITLATDNDILRSLGETGLLGTLSLIFVFAILIKGMWRFIRLGRGLKKLFTIGVFTGFIGLLMTSTFIDVFEASKIAEVFWLILGVNWALITQAEDD